MSEERRRKRREKRKKKKEGVRRYEVVGRFTPKELREITLSRVPTEIRRAPLEVKFVARRVKWETLPWFLRMVASFMFLEDLYPAGYELDGRYMVVSQVLPIAVYLSRRTRRPVVRILDSDLYSDIVCYYMPRTRRWTCRSARKHRGDYQMHYARIFEACYPHGRKGHGDKKTNNLHVESHRVHDFTTRDINRYIRRHRARRYRSIRMIFRYFSEILSEMKVESEICYCDELGFLNCDVLIYWSSEHVAIYSLTRVANACYYDRCETAPEVPPEISTIEMITRLRWRGG